jgi:hypothetical protein
MNEIKIHAFIFNWRGQYEKTIELEKEFSRHVDKLTVINSDNNNKKDHWVNIGEDSYFGDQFCKAVELFDGDILFHTQADVSSPNNEWEQIINSAKKYYIKYDYGVYSPNIDHTNWNNIRASIERLTSEEIKNDNLTIVSNTDCSSWFISDSLIKIFKSKYLQICKENKIGWGIDQAICLESLIDSRPVLRDNNFNLQHPKSTGYNVNIASQMLTAFMKKIIDKRISFLMSKLDNIDLFTKFLIKLRNK